MGVTDNRKVSVRLGSEVYKQLREIGNDLNREFDLIGNESATINDVVEGLVRGYHIDKAQSSLKPLAKIGEIVARRKFRPKK